MSCKDSRVVLAIDGGGTRCRFALLIGKERFTCELGSANVFTDFDGAVHCITSGVSQLARASGFDTEAIYGAPAYIGLAGANVEATRAKLEETLDFKVAIFEDDRNAAIRGALGESDGFLAHCGTGSFFASQLAGARKLYGGWGPILGDEASGSWMGKKALSSVLQHIDGRKSCPDLASGVLKELKDADGIVGFAAIATPEQFGAFAPFVTDGARQGDSSCIEILCKGSSLVSQSLDRAGWQPGNPICLTGGLAPEYRAYLPQEKAQALREPLGQPIEGAIALARQLEKGLEIGS